MARRTVHHVVHRKAPVRPSALTKSLKKLYFKSRKLDATRHALPPGKRTARRSRKTYYERRVNRSDRSKKRPYL